MSKVEFKLHTGQRVKAHIVDRLPLVGEHGREHVDSVIESVSEAYLDCEQPWDSVYEYEYYLVVANYNQYNIDNDDVLSNDEYYVAIQRNED